MFKTWGVRAVSYRRKLQLPLPSKYQIKGQRTMVRASEIRAVAAIGGEGLEIPFKLIRARTVTSRCIKSPKENLSREHTYT